MNKRNCSTTLTANAIMTPATVEMSRNSLYALAKILDNGLTVNEMKQEIFRKLKEARNNNELTAIGGRCVFPLGVDGEGFLVNGIVEKNRNAGERELYFVFEVTQIRPLAGETEVSPAAAVTAKAEKEQPAPGKVFEGFAFLESWEKFLGALAAKAVPEEWDYPGDPPHSRYILKNYVRFTFERLMLEGKVLTSPDGELAAFNTGLLDRTSGEDIIACFVPNEPGRGKKWRFADFCTVGTGTYGKKLLETMGQLPQPARYITGIEDLVLDGSRQIHVDVEHIIRDNLNRLPIQFLQQVSLCSPVAHTLTSRIAGCSGKKDKKALYALLNSEIFNNGTLFQNIKSLLEAAVKQAQRQVRTNYKTAVPFYYPRKNTMCLMLPLALTGIDGADAALVISAAGDSYQGQTIFTLADAYMDARLVCSKPESWLSPGSLNTAAAAARCRVTSIPEELTA